MSAMGPIAINPGSSSTSRNRTSIGRQRIQKPATRATAPISSRRCADRPSERIKVEDEGERARIVAHWLKPPAQWLATRPVFIASATADPDLWRQWFPTLQHRPPPAAAMPNVTIRQYTGGFGKWAMRRRRPALIERTQHEMQDLGTAGLTITYKEHAPAFR
jgi:hypothetical protein